MESHLSRWALVRVSVRSLTATTSSSPAVVLIDRLEGQPADSSEAVDADPGGHVVLLIKAGSCDDCRLSARSRQLIVYNTVAAESLDGAGGPQRLNVGDGLRDGHPLVPVGQVVELDAAGRRHPGDRLRDLVGGLGARFHGGQDFFVAVMVMSHDLFDTPGQVVEDLFVARQDRLDGSDP